PLSRHPVPRGVAGPPCRGHGLPWNGGPGYGPARRGQETSDVRSLPARIRYLLPLELRPIGKPNDVPRPDQDRCQSPARSSRAEGRSASQERLQVCYYQHTVGSMTEPGAARSVAAIPATLADSLMARLDRLSAPKEPPHPPPLPGPAFRAFG